MKHTEILGLPIYDNPSTDLFKIDDVNNAHNKIEQQYNELKNIKETVESTNPSAILQGQINETKASLETIVSETKNIQDTKRVAMVSFEVDDGTASDLSILKPIFQQYKIPLTCALITKNLNNITERVRLQNEEGWEFASHTHNHLDLTSLTESQIEYELTQSLSVLRQNGFNVNNITYPQGLSNETVERIAKKYYKHGCRYQEGLNYDVINSFKIFRYPLGSYYTSPDPSHQTLEFYKAKVDEAISNNAWLIFGLHSESSDFNATQQQYLRDVIEYIQSKNIKIVTISKGYEVFGNAVETGSASYYNGLTVGFDGSTNIPIVRLKDQTYKANDLITIYPKNKISIAQIGNYDNAGFPENVGGILETYRTTDFAFQFFYPTSGNRIYKRRVVGTTWQPFESIQKTVTLTGIKNDTLISSFEQGLTTYSFIGNYDNANLPENKGGCLTTVRHSNDDTFSYQIFDTLDSGFTYKRKWKATVWSEWVLISTKVSRVAFDLTMSTNFQKTNTYVNKYICIDKWISIGGTQPTFTKELWGLSEISTDSANPTILGTCGTGRDVQGYISTLDKSLYIKYSSVGNNYPTFFEMSFS